MRRFYGSLLIIVILSGCIGGIDLGDFKNKLKSMASNSAIDCGHVKVEKDFLSQQACAKAAFESNQEFFVSYALRGMDSYPARGYLLRDDGVLLELLFDSDPSGGGKKNRGRISVNQCVSPKFIGLEWRTSHIIFECASIIPE